VDLRRDNRRRRDRRWQRVGDAVVFTPQTGIPARTRETVIVSAGDGTARSGWADLLRAAAAGEHNQHGYGYAIASQSIPEMVTP
jgi:hypothetical protein